MTDSTSSTDNTAAREADPVGDYARAVLAGTIVAGRWIKLACERHLKDLETGAARGLAFDRRKALRAIEFFPAVLRHYKGKWGKDGGQPFELSDWQKFVVGSIFGWLNAATGLRRFRIAYLEVARKNGKSALAAGIGLIMFLFDEEPGAEVYTAATKRDQALIVWGDAEQFVRRSPALWRRVEVFTGMMSHRASASKFAPLSADDKTMDGLNPHAVVIDELHRHPTRKIVDVMTTAQGSREQPLQIEITTAGDSVESVCWEHHDYTVKVLEGTFDDDTWFGAIYALDDGDDWKDEAAWPKANPNLGISKDPDYLRAEVRRAVNQPAAAKDCKRLHCGLWTEEAGGWMAMPRWNACDAAVDVAALKGRECMAGIDLASTTDVTAYVELYAPTADDPRWRVLPFFWVPEAKVHDAKMGEFGDRVPYHLWKEAGLIFATPGDVVDYAAMREHILARADEVRIAEIGFDPWNATQLSNELQGEGFVMVEVRQGFKTLSEPTKELMKLVLQKKLAHGGNRVLRWMASNVAIDRDPADNHKPNKRLSRQRIDGITATIIALSRWMPRISIKPKKSVYAERGLVAL